MQCILNIIYLFSKAHNIISQGRVATHLRCGGTLDHVPLTVPVKEFLISQCGYNQELGS